MYKKEKKNKEVSKQVRSQECDAQGTDAESCPTLTSMELRNSGQQDVELPKSMGTMNETKKIGVAVVWCMNNDISCRPVCFYYSYKDTYTLLSDWLSDPLT